MIAWPDPISCVAKKCLDFGLPHVARVLLRAKIFDITDDPVAVRLLRTVGVILVTKNLPDWREGGHILISELPIVRGR